MITIMAITFGLCFWVLKWIFYDADEILQLPESVEMHSFLFVDVYFQDIHFNRK